MSALHSIWLMPSPGNEAVLRSIVEDLAGRFASPLFQPHLTLVEEQKHGLAELASACRTLAAETEQFSAQIQGIGINHLYFRSLYAVFQPEGALMRLRRGMVEALSLGTVGAFMPHVSLLYGVEAGMEKEQARTALEHDLRGTSVCFDRICVVASAKTIPVAEWAVRFTAAFHPARA
ncbi:MAG TPA: 2'-5' RNA ligase family protein [Dongiaceae bacterium]